MGVCEWVMWLLNYAPDDRPSSAIEASQVLHDLVAGDLPRSAVTRRVKPHGSTKKRRRLPIALVAVLGILGLGVAGYLVGTQRSGRAAPSGYVLTGPDHTFRETFQAFEGLGFSPNPMLGELSSQGWRIYGLDRKQLSFGGTAVSNRWAKGLSPGGVEAGGIYAFETGDGNRILGIQPSGSNFTYGDLDLRLANAVSNRVAAVEVSYALWVHNDADRSMSVDVSWSLDDRTYEPIPALSTVTPLAASDAPVWTASPMSVVLRPMSWSGGESLYLRWHTDDAGRGSDVRDELGLDDIVVRAILAD